MTHPTDGGPAFPRIGQTVDFGDGWIPGDEGMSLRAYFAGQAPPMDRKWAEWKLWNGGLDQLQLHAMWAVAYADALIAELAKGQKQ